jgi:hypothetical protein
LLGLRLDKDPSSSFTVSLRYCHTTRQGKSDLAVAASSAAEKSTGYPYAKSKHTSTRDLSAILSSNSERINAIASVLEGGLSIEE